MKDDNKNLWTRREFTVESALAMLGGVAITISGCGDGDSPAAPTPPPTAAPPPPPPQTATGATGVVGTNHGHTASISGGELSGGADINLDITGDSNHPHSVALTAGELGQIAAGTRVQKVSTNNAGHTHTVTFN